MSSDIYYRALVDYRKNTVSQKDCVRQRKTIENANPENDLIEVVRTNCIIKDDWIEAIEKGLIPLEKALKEERQFIATNGEIVPIEKVRNVSRDSVEHLAKHSNLITRVPEGDDIIPDELYTVERLSDYSVYENRFLYMLLCYLRDFISYRYDKILDLTNTYSGKMVMKKTILTQNGKTAFEISLDENHRDDEYLKTHNPAKSQLERIDLLLKTVTLYLSSPLMKLVSQAPLLKPPITETNVLKMDFNFKGAMELYYYITSYEGDGFTIERDVKKIAPFGEIVGDEFAEVVAISSFLTYKYGLGLSDKLKANYEAEERERERKEEQAHLEQLERLKKRIRETGESPEEYMLQLEQHNRKLESENSELLIIQSKFDDLNNQISDLTEKNEQLTKTNEQLNTTINNLNQQIATQEEEFKRQMAELNAQHDKRINDLIVAYEGKLGELTESYMNQIAKLNEEHEQDIIRINGEHEQEKEKLNQEHEEATKQLQENFEAERNELNNQIEAINNKMTDEHTACEELIAKNNEEKNQALNKFDEINDKYKKSEEQKIVLRAQINSLRQQQGLFTGKEEFTKEENFEEIERQYKAFKAFFNEQWRATKKRIRKEVLHQPKGDVNNDDIDNGEAH